jgi:hypothetical protein
MALGDSYEGRNRLEYTGRHWWGVPDSYEGVEPITGGAADELAGELGLPDFGPHERGTTILIVGADFGEAASTAAASMADAVAWHCWPKITDFGGGSDMKIEIWFEGKRVKIPDPSAHPELREYVAALRSAITPQSSVTKLTSDLISVDSLRPIKHLGWLALRNYLSGNEPSSPARPFQGPSHHVALLRQPKLVVSYLPGPPSPVQGTAWAGVFLADPEVDDAFAASEPPSHDDWQYATLPSRSRERTYVKVALDRVREEITYHARPPAPPGDVGSASLAFLADTLGGLIAEERGPGTRGGAPIRGNTAQARERAASRRPRGVLEAGAPVLRVERGQRVIEVPFQLRPAIGTRRCDVEAIVGVAVNDGSYLEREEPLNTIRPRVLSWICDGSQRPASTVLSFAGDATRSCSVVVSAPPDVAVVVELLLRSEA